MLLIKEENFHITELCPNILTVPIGIEITWALLTPKVKVEHSTISHIAVAALYYTEKTKKSVLMDHISSSYHLLHGRYGERLQWILMGDYNKCNVNPILGLSDTFKQIVNFPTRLNPDSILDKIITSMAQWYKLPQPLSFLECDDGKQGKKSDHLPVFWEPLNSSFPAKEMKTVKVCPHPESSICAF